MVHINQQPILCTASWDKTLRYWDMRQPQPMHQQAMPERVYAMDVKNNLLVAGLANRHIQVRHRAAQGFLLWGARGNISRLSQSVGMQGSMAGQCRGEQAQGQVHVRDWPGIRL